MKSKLLKFTLVIVVAIVAVVNVFNAQNPVQLSDVAMANVEALASNEVVPGYTGPSELYDCPLWFTGDGVLCKSENSNSCSVITCD